MTFIAFLAFLIAPVMQVVNIGTQLTEAFAGLERTREVLRERPEDEDPKRTVAAGHGRRRSRFSNTSDFSYDTGKQVLFDVSFRSEPGTVTALVEPSGSGKSTIISLIAAFHNPERRDASPWTAWISPPCGWIPIARSWAWCLQDTFLFDGTIEENIAFARPGATHEQIMEACRIARVDEFAENFEKKYDTIVGERGVKLSGGQRQRVSIARAILADPRILILDEATSSLDSESEALIQEGLKYLMKGRTTFVIAHRLSTIRRADQILVVEGGQNRRARHARVALCARRPLLGSVHAPARPRSESVSRARRRRQGRGERRFGRSQGIGRHHRSDAHHARLMPRPTATTRESTSSASGVTKGSFRRR